MVTVHISWYFHKMSIQIIFFFLKAKQEATILADTCKINQLAKLWSTLHKLRSICKRKKLNQGYKATEYVKVWLIYMDLDQSKHHKTRLKLMVHLELRKTCKWQLVYIFTKECSNKNRNHSQMSRDLLNEKKNAQIQNLDLYVFCLMNQDLKTLQGQPKQHL